MLMLDKKSDVQLLRSLGADHNVIQRIFILEGMIRIAVRMCIRSHQDDARKGAFMEAGIEYEIMKPSHYCSYPDVKGIFLKNFHYHEEEGRGK